MTEQRLVEKALIEKKSILRSIIDNANALIFSIDRQYRYTSFNQRHAAVMNALYGAEIEHGGSILGYMSVPEDRDTARRNLDRALAGEQLVEEAYSGEDLRSRHYFQVSHSPIKTDSGEIIGVAVLAQDMTERQRVELEILDRQQRLAELVGKYTALEGLETGNRGHLVKECASEELLVAMRSMYAGKPGFCSGAVKEHFNGLAPVATVAQEVIAPALTRREQEVLKLTAEGYNTKESAFELGVSVKMIETHRKHIKQKLKLKNVAQLVTYAARTGLISIGGADER